MLVEPQEIVVGGIKLLILAKSQRCGFRPAPEVDCGSLVIPFLHFGMAVHEAERASVAVEDAQRIPQRIRSGIVGPAVDIVVDAGGVVYLFDKKHLRRRTLELGDCLRIGTFVRSKKIRQRIAAVQQMLQLAAIARALPYPVIARTVICADVPYIGPQGAFSEPVMPLLKRDRS